MLINFIFLDRGKTNRLFCMGKSSQMALWIVGDGSLQNFGMGCIGYVASDGHILPIVYSARRPGVSSRVAFNLDNFFKKACAHGKQSLTMCMGFGCNAAGVIGCRIIDSPRERLIATITNNFVPCNGRFPTLIAIITMFFVGKFCRFFSIGAFNALFDRSNPFGYCDDVACFKTSVQNNIKRTSFFLRPGTSAVPEAPNRQNYRKVIFDRTLFVLGRAVSVAIPAGFVIWIMANIYVGEQSLLSLCAGFLDPFARLIGLDGYILMAFHSRFSCQ